MSQPDHPPIATRCADCHGELYHNAPMTVPNCEGRTVLDCPIVCLPHPGCPMPLEAMHVGCAHIHTNQWSAS